MANEPQSTIFTIGHSTRTIDEFVELLKTRGVTMLVMSVRFPAADITHNLTKKLCITHSKPKA